MLYVVVFAVVFGACFGWFSNRSGKHKEDEFNKKLRQELRERALQLDSKEALLRNLRDEFSKSFLKGRKWLASFVAEADRASDDAIANHLRRKSHPALKAAESLAKANSERRAYKTKALELEYQLKTLNEYFPVLEEYQEAILDEAVQLGEADDSLAALAESDSVLRFVSKQEYETLSVTERNQLALDLYLAGTLSPVEVGRLYEMYLGHLYESAGWRVEYHGIDKGLEDLGRDLICSKGTEIKIVQAKCWSSSKSIHEKHIFQLFGTKCLFEMDLPRGGLFAPKITASFETTTVLSETARKAARFLGIEVKEQQELIKSFPMIKCNVNQQTNTKIYHLPFDQQYKRTKVLHELGECYVTTVAEAESLGFRRAYRFRGMADA